MFFVLVFFLCILNILFLFVAFRPSSSLSHSLFIFYLHIFVVVLFILIPYFFFYFNHLSFLPFSISSYVNIIFFYFGTLIFLLHYFRNITSLHRFNSVTSVVCGVLRLSGVYIQLRLEQWPSG